MRRSEGKATDKNLRVALISKQVGHYHHARFKSAARKFSDFTVITSVNQADFQEFMAIDEPDYPIVRLFPTRSAYEAASSSSNVGTALSRTLDIVNPDVLFVPGWASPESYAAIVWARTAYKRIVVMSDSRFEDGSGSFAGEFLKSRIVRLCDAAFVAGRAHAQYVTRLGFPAEHIHLGYDVVDNAHFSDGALAARRQEHEERSKKCLPKRYILASSRFLPLKNLCALVVAYSIAVKASCDIPDLVILGDGPERAVIEATIQEYSLGGRVHLPGFRSYCELPAYYGLAEGFVHVSKSDTWGLVINEAAAAGLPLIVSKSCGAASELVRDYKNGFIVSPNDPSDMTAALLRLCNLRADERAAMGKVSQEIVANWGLGRYSEGINAAAQSGMVRPARGLAPWDRYLLRQLERHWFTVLSCQSEIRKSTRSRL